MSKMILPAMLLISTTSYASNIPEDVLEQLQQHGGRIDLSKAGIAKVQLGPQYSSSITKKVDGVVVYHEHKESKGQGPVFVFKTAPQAISKDVENSSEDEK